MTQIEKCQRVKLRRLNLTKVETKLVQSRQHLREGAN